MQSLENGTLRIRALWYEQNENVLEVPKYIDHEASRPHRKHHKSAYI